MNGVAPKELSGALSLKARKRIMQARATLILDQPFFGLLALRLRLVEDYSCPTAWTDGTSLGYHPAFIDTLTDEQLLAVIAHEVLHCSNGHPWRRDARDPMWFNVAADYAINYVLAEAKFKLPDGCLRDAQYDGKSAEWIYPRLQRTQPPQSGQGKGTAGGSGTPQPGEGMPGAGGMDVRDAPASGHADGDEDDANGGDGSGAVPPMTESDWTQATQEAAQSAKMRGKLPASLDRIITATLQPRVDWKSVLRRFMQSAAKADYVWTRPNPRYTARGLYLPSLHSEQMGVIAVVIDTSGSVDAVTLNLFGGEINAIAAEMRPERVYVIYCDAQVHKIDIFERDEPISLKAIGGGGTDFRPALDAAEQLEDEPVCLVYLTDRYGTDRPNPPAFPVLWASIGDQTAPYGEVLSLRDV